jgi:hypothetical protein
MAATQTTVYAENPLRDEESAFRRRFTDADLESLPAVSLPKGTNVSANTPTDSTTSGRRETSEHMPSLIASSTGRRSVDAVIDEIMRDSVVVRCLLPAGNTVDLRLPPSIIPGQLLRYGQPVTVSLDSSGGVRVPRIEARKIAAQSNEFPDQKIIDEWLDSI